MCVGGNKGVPTDLYNPSKLAQTAWPYESYAFILDRLAGQGKYYSILPTTPSLSRPHPQKQNTKFLHPNPNPHTNSPPCSRSHKDFANCSQNDTAFGDFPCNCLTIVLDLSCLTLEIKPNPVFSVRYSRIRLST